jgi:hypothetical protein
VKPTKRNMSWALNYTSWLPCVFNETDYELTPDIRENRFFFCWMGFIWLFLFPFFVLLKEEGTNNLSRSSWRCYTNWWTWTFIRPSSDYSRGPRCQIIVTKHRNKNRSILRNYRMTLAWGLVGISFHSKRKLLCSIPGEEDAQVLIDPLNYFFKMESIEKIGQIWSKEFFPINCEDWHNDLLSSASMRHSNGYTIRETYEIL